MGLTLSIWFGMKDAIKAEIKSVLLDLAVVMFFYVLLCWLPKGNCCVGLLSSHSLGNPPDLKEVGYPQESLRNSNRYTFFFPASLRFPYFFPIFAEYGTKKTRFFILLR